jgi:hypothetical protein
LAEVFERFIVPVFVILGLLSNRRCAELIRLTAVLQRNRGHRHVDAERLGDGHRALSTGLITIAHQHDAVEMAHEQVGLISRKRGAHEPDDGRIAGLMQGECVEEAFDDDVAGSGRERSMQIDERERFTETSRETVLRLLVVDRTLPGSWRGGRRHGSHSPRLRVQREDVSRKA